MNGVIPVAFKFTPLAKVRLHRIKIFLSENIEYYCRDKKVHRLEPRRKLLLYEKQAQKSGEGSPREGLVRQNSQTPAAASGVSATGVSVSGSRPPVATPLARLPGLGRPIIPRQASSREDFSANSLLGNLEGGDASGVSTEFEVEVPLPGCQVVRAPLDSRNKNSPQIPVRFHHGTIWPNIAVHHWIKIVLRISKADESTENKSKRRHFEISIDSPIHLLSVLPVYRNTLILVSVAGKYLSPRLYKSHCDPLDRSRFIGLSLCTNKKRTPRHSAISEFTHAAFPAPYSPSNAPDAPALHQPAGLLRRRCSPAITHSAAELRRSDPAHRGATGIL